MHAAPLTSWRLQALLKLLSDGKPHSTRQITDRTGVLAVGTSVSELRAHGADIICKRKQIEERGHKKWVYYYTMQKGPKT